MDMRGHGLSDGSPALIPSIDLAITDFNEFFEKSLQKFYGE
jgi:hypothetical protein